MTTELKPCRVCNRPAPEVFVTGNGFGDRDGWAMTCDCGVRVKRPSEAAVEFVWNTLMSQPDVPVAVAVEETLHDRYVMAALTGWMANPASGDCTVKACVDDAFAAADAAMKARKT